MSASHYGHCQSAAEINKHINMIGDRLVEWLDGRTPVLVYRGMSGIGWATALMLWLTDVKGIVPCMMYVRKDAEVKDSHGSRLEHFCSLGNKVRGCVPVFVDDFVGGGKTLVECITHTSALSPRLVGNEWRVDWENAIVVQCVFNQIDSIKKLDRDHVYKIMDELKARTAHDEVQF